MFLLKIGPRTFQTHKRMNFGLISKFQKIMSQTLKLLFNFFFNDNIN